MKIRPELAAGGSDFSNCRFCKGMYMMTPKKAAESNAGGGFIAPVIDLAHLDQYTLGDLSLQSELLHLFRIQLQNQAEELFSCSEEAKWRSAVHTLKGAARSIGAGQVADVAEELELVSFADETGRAAVLKHLDTARTVFEEQVHAYIQ